jgi:hypothetical protein
MKTMLSGNVAVALFDNVTEQGKVFCRIHIYNRQSSEWVHDSILVVRKNNVAVEVSDVNISDGSAVVTLTQGYKEQRLVFEKAAQGWCCKSYSKTPWQAGGAGYGPGKSLFSKIATFFKMPASALPA